MAEEERAELDRRARSRAGRAADARIARVLLLLADGKTCRDIAERVDCSEPFIARWKKRFIADGLAGLYARHEGRPVTVLTPKMEARILNWTRKKPTDGSTHWSTRRLARKLGIRHVMVAGTWKKHGIQPHRIERYMASKGHGFESIRHGTLSLYAAPDAKTGEVHGKTTSRHTSQEFVAFLSDLIVKQPADQEIHIILDDLSAQQTKRVDEFLEAHPNVTFHFTPTYSSWLNRVELWLATSH